MTKELEKEFKDFCKILNSIAKSLNNGDCLDVQERLACENIVDEIQRWRKYSYVAEEVSAYVIRNGTLPPYPQYIADMKKRIQERLQLEDEIVDRILTTQYGSLKAMPLTPSNLF